MSKKVLSVKSSPRNNDSITNQLIHEIEQKISAKYENTKIIHKDLTKDPLPHPNNETISAYFTPAEYLTEDLIRSAALSNSLTEEVLTSDTIIIGIPMWNFSIPSSLKAWIDHIVRVNKTFALGEKGYKGLAENKNAILVIASGGIYSGTTMDFTEPYLRFILNFIGISNVQVVRTEGLSYPDKSIMPPENCT